jgi:hypothetical protein
MALTVTWAFGATSYSKTYQATNTKARATIMRYADYIGLETEGLTDEQIIHSVIDRHIQDIMEGARLQQVSSGIQTSRAAIEETAAADNVI